MRGGSKARGRTRGQTHQANLSRGLPQRGQPPRATSLAEPHRRGANLSRGKLLRGHLYETVFSNTDLTAVRGLETCDHIGPSILDHRTLAKSGPLPLAFLRGCGLPEALIEYLPSLLRAFPVLLLLHQLCEKDHVFAERLYADLQNKGVRCWFAPEDMKIGDRLRPRIDETIRLYDKLLLVLSKTSVASQWVEQEVETALARERQQGTTILFPVRIDDTVMTLETGWPALIRNTRNIGDFRRWKRHDVYRRPSTGCYGTSKPLRHRRTINARILLANLLQSSRSTFSWGSFLSFFAFKEGMLDTQISALGGWPTVSARYLHTR